MHDPLAGRGHGTVEHRLNESTSSWSLGPHDSVALILEDGIDDYAVEEGHDLVVGPLPVMA